MTGPSKNRAPRIARECTHKQARHVHGTATMYKVDRCRCAPCTDAVAAAERRRVLNAVIGADPVRVDAAPVRDHIRALQAAGIGYKRVAELAGLAPSTVAKIINRDPSREDGAPQARVHPDTARKVLAVQASMDTVSDGGIIDATGTLRRLHALHARGWSRRALAVRLGVEHNTLTHIERAGTSSGRLARAVRDLYQELWDAEPPSVTAHDRAARTRTLRWAQRHGWPPPAAFDDEEIDDPRENIDEKARRRAGLTSTKHRPAAPVAVKPGRLPALERLDELMWLVDAGTPIPEALRRSGYADIDSARSVAARHGHRAARLALPPVAVAA